jgi:CBS domain containing-hemolysin-like protein
MLSDILITLALVLLNGFFVAAEFAIVKVRASQIEVKAQSGHRAARLSSHIVHNLDGYLAATQLGITLASLGLGWVGEPVVSKIIIQIFDIFGLQLAPETAHNIALPVAFAIITVLHIVFGELAPKSMAIQKPESTTLWVAYPLNAFYYIFKPFIWVLNGFANIILRTFGIHSAHGSEVHSSDELKYLIQQSSESNHESKTDYEIIKNAFDFADRNAKQIMVPRNSVVAISANDWDDSTLKRILDEGYSRIPVYENTIDNIIGIIYVKDILTTLNQKKEIKVRDLVRPVIITSEMRKIDQLLKEFQHKHVQMAIIVNEFGGTEGIVTLEDIIEEIVGEIQDEYDNEVPVVEKIDDRTYHVVATASINDINVALPYAIDESPNATTLAGIVIEAFGRIPNTNDKINIEEYEVTILKRTKNTISIVQLKDLSSL